MKLAIDVYYFNENNTKAVGVCFQEWESPEPAEIFTNNLDNAEKYEPGNFYKRELPCIIKLLELINTENIDVIIIDGYVYLEDMSIPGLGLHLYNAIERKIPIIGVAKTYYHTNIAEKILRGKSKTPLYITSAGMEAGEAAGCIKNMYGDYRIPKLLQLLDRETKRA